LLTWFDSTVVTPAQDWRPIEIPLFDARNEVRWPQRVEEAGQPETGDDDHHVEQRREGVEVERMRGFTLEFIHVLVLERE
jgi:hypothetical protein